MKQYTFLQEDDKKTVAESLIGDFLKHNAMCDRAQTLRDKIGKECIFQIKKIKDFYRQGRINGKQYKFLLAKQQDKLSRLQLRLDNLGLL